LAGKAFSLLFLSRLFYSSRQWISSWSLRYIGLMENVTAIAAFAAVILASVQSLLVLIRVPGCVRRAEPLLLAASLCLLALLPIVPAHSFPRDALLILLLWTAGSFLRGAGARNAGATRRRRVPAMGSLAAWSAAIAAFLFVLVLAAGLGYSSTVPFAVFRVVGIGIMGALIVATIAGLRAASRSWAALTVFLSCCLWLAVGALHESLLLLRRPSPDFSAWPLLLLLFGTGWLVLQEGYPARPGLRGGLDAGHGREGLTQSVYARLLAAENALALRERLVASATLALGAAHEFKNILSHIRATAQHGLEHSDPRAAQGSLRLILDHAMAGQDTAIGLLEKAAGAGRDEPRIIDASRDLAGFIRMARAAFRGDGVLIESDLAAGGRFRARLNEVEHILLNLLRNSADAYRRSQVIGNRTVHLGARQADNATILEVSDSAGGIPLDSVHRLFYPSFSHSENTGLGLYLSRSLALANDGSLQYEPTGEGSIFRLTLPAAEGEEEGERP
jgi:signal transduction histidine kinase